MKKTSLIFLTAALLASAVFPVSAQNYRQYEQLLRQDKMKADLSFMADDAAKGRESGTPEKQAIEQFLVEEFRQMGLKPYEWSYTQSFRHDTIAVRNVVGCIPAARPSDQYIIIGAHYDHIGQLAGRIFNGADDNASGVTALLSLARLYSAMKADGRGPAKNLIFIAFDGKELSLSGSSWFASHLNIPKENITCAINIDMLGTNLVPTGINKDYLIALGEDSLPERYQGYLSYICRRPLYKMDLDLTFYKSKNFTKMIYETGDQYPFAKRGIPAVLFTSAFHQHTYKPTDDVDIIDFPLLRRRTLVIFNFINRLCSE